MGLKMAVVLLILAALLLFSLTTESGKRYLAFLLGKVRELSEAVPTIAPGQAAVNLSIPHEQLEGKTFNLANSTFNGHGIVNLFLKEFAMRGGEEVEIRLGIESGKVTFLGRKGVRIFGLATFFEFGRNKVETPVEISIEIVPTNFTLSNVWEKSIALGGISGELRGTKATITLEKRNVDISEFTGDVIYADQIVSLSGNTTKVLINGNDITNII